MKTNFKKTIITLAMGSAFAFTAGIALTNNITASAAATTNSDYVVENSASLRIENFGMRFKTSIATNKWDNDMEVHTLMVPTSYLNGAELTVASVEDVGAIDKTLDNAKKYEKNGSYYFNTVLTGIPQTQYGTEVSMRAYVVNGGVTEYSPVTVSTSVAYVANAALTYNYDTYAADLSKYLVKGIEVDEEKELALGATNVELGAILTYFDEASADVMAKLNEKYSLTYASSAENVVTVENGKLTTVAAGEAVITVSNEELGFEKTCAVTVVAPTYNPLFDFEHPDESKLSASKGSVVTVGEDEDGSYVELRGTDTNQHLHINSLAGIEGLRQYDWYKITYKAYYEDAEGNAVTSKNFCLRPGNKWIKDAFAANGVKTTYEVNRNNKSNFEETINSTSFPNVSYVCQSYDTSNTLVVRFYNIEFGYNDITTDGVTAIDLTSKFGATADELTATFTPTGGTVKEITNEAAWTPTGSGALKVVINRAGYKPQTIELNVAELPEYDPLFDFEHPDESKLSASNGSTLSIGSDGDGTYVELRGTATYQHLHINSLAGIEGLRQYDWYKITYKAYYEDAEGNAVTSKNFCLRPGNKWIKDAFAANGVKTTYEVNRNNKSNFEETINSTSFPNVSYVCQSYDTSNTLVVRFYNIEFGYNDIESDGSAIDLTSKFGATADELTATFTPTGGTATVITDKTAWTPTESGVLKVVINRAGYKPQTIELNVNVTTGA